MLSRFLAIPQGGFKALSLHQFFELEIFFGCIVKNGSYSPRNDNKINFSNFVKKIYYFMYDLRITIGMFKASFVSQLFESSNFFGSIVK